MILQKVYQFLRLFTIIKLLILLQSFYFTHILHSSESLVYNWFYIVYDYNHYNILYKQCSIYSGTKLSISNFECPIFFTNAVASHYYQGWPVAFTGGICHRYLPVNTGVDNTPKSGVYRHLLAFINISLISLQITLLTVLATYYIIHGHHSTIFAAYA